MKLSTISSFKAGSTIRGFYICKEKSHRNTKNGAPYLDIVLQDRTGKISAKIWDDVVHFDDLFVASEPVAVKGKVSDNLPVFKIKKSEIDKGLNILDLVVRAKLLNSKSEVRRSIKDKGIKIDDIPVKEENYLISIADFKDDIDLIKLSHGKKNHVIIKLVN